MVTNLKAQLTPYRSYSLLTRLDNKMSFIRYSLNMHLDLDSEKDSRICPKISETLLETFDTSPIEGTDVVLIEISGFIGRGLDRLFDIPKNSYVIILIDVNMNGWDEKRCGPVCDYFDNFVSLVVKGIHQNCTVYCPNAIPYGVPACSLIETNDKHFNLMVEISGKDPDFYLENLETGRFGSSYRIW